MKKKIKYKKKYKKSNIKKSKYLKKKIRQAVFTSPGPFPINLFLDVFQ